MSSKAEKAYCSHCQSETLVHECRLYDGLIVRGIRRCCAFCHQELVDQQTTSVQVPKVTSPLCSERGSGLDLATLLGGDDSEQAEQQVAVREFLQDNPSAEAFCKNCRHSFLTPFCCQCVLHHKEVDPMSDCPDFAPKLEGPVSL